MAMEKFKYDFLVVGAGLFGCVCAHELVKRGCKVLVVEKRGHTGGNCAVRTVKGKIQHMYGPHIFHTDDKRIWDYLNDVEAFVPYRHKVVAVNGGLQYDFPINRVTLCKVFGENAPLFQGAGESARNFEEAARLKVGDKLYDLLYRYYTAKQWGREPKNLPSEIFSRVPVRLNFDDGYFNDRYTGVIGSNRLFDKLLDGATVKLNCAYSDKKHGGAAKRIIYTGMIDEFKHYRLGKLPYRSLRFVCRKVMPYENQGVAVINYTDSRPYTRSCEYGYMYGGRQTGGLRWYEYPLGELDARGKATEPYYPMPTAEAGALYEEYAALAKRDTPDGVRVYFGGRLGEYKYINMDQAVERALKLVNEIYHSEIKGVNL